MSQTGGEPEPARAGCLEPYPLEVEAELEAFGPGVRSRENNFCD